MSLKTQNLISKIARPHWDKLVQENPELKREDGPDWDFQTFCEELVLEFKVALDEILTPREVECFLNS